MNIHYKNNTHRVYASFRQKSKTNKHTNKNLHLQQNCPNLCNLELNVTFNSARPWQGTACVPSRKAALCAREPAVLDKTACKHANTSFSLQPGKNLALLLAVSSKSFPHGQTSELWLVTKPCLLQGQRRGRWDKELGAMEGL